MSARRPLRVGILGFGSLGQHLYEAVRDGQAGDAQVGFVWNRSADKLAGVPAELRLAELSVESIAARGVDVVVEVAHPSISADLGPAILRSGANFLCGSPTALADAEVEAALRAAAAVAAGLFVPSGALWGAADLQSMANRGTIAALTVTMKKHPDCLRLSEALSAKMRDLLAATDGAVVVYEGPVRALCPLAPNNVNTMACAALAAKNLGFDGAVGRLVADPSLSTHEIEIEALGPVVAAGAPRFRCLTCRSSPSPAGAVTSKATYGAFLQSLLTTLDTVQGGPRPGLHFV
jgi:aspartate dehydrogenase